MGGVAAGIAGFVGAGAWTVRWLWLLSLPLSGGLTGLVYLLLWALIPSESG